MKDAGDGGGKFGSRGLKVNGKMYAFMSKGLFIVKLPAARVAELVAKRIGSPWDPGHGRTMKEWVAITKADADREAFAEEARAFVAAGARKARKK